MAAKDRKDRKDRKGRKEGLAADVSPMKQCRTKGRENSRERFVRPPSPGGEGRGEGERFL